MNDRAGMVRVMIHEAEQARRLRLAAIAIRDVAAADGVSCDGWSSALAAWEQIIGEPVHNDILRLAIALGDFPEPAGRVGG